ncbi:GNAT family N-acetyltransferase [Longispora albida]|uniref:GNAT family N-acetyltransferase n=1 Tax=Longispora albida TaxID=203523 RepID=UPI0003823EB2|nr:GNAT family N-acetyltransferase [Longispora albida]
MNGTIRRLGVAELPACMALAADRGWQPEEAKWRLLFSVGEVYGLELGGQVIATATLTRYGTGLGAISMVLVAAAHEGKGHGRRIMNHLIDAAGPETTVFLHATPMGQPLYEKLGFRVTHHVGMHAGTMDVPPARISRPATHADLPDLIALDAKIFGVERADLVTRLLDFAASVRIALDGSGYAAAWDNTSNHVIGPLLAGSLTTAQGLVSDLAADVAGPVRLDLDDPALTSWALGHGAQLFASGTFMVRGAGMPGLRAHVWSPVMQALG